MKQSSSVYLYVKSDSLNAGLIDEILGVDTSYNHAGRRRWTWLYQFDWYHEEDIVEAIRKTFFEDITSWKSKFQKLLMRPDVKCECHWVIGALANEDPEDLMIPNLNIPHIIMKEIASYKMDFNIYLESQVWFDTALKQ